MTDNRTQHTPKEFCVKMIWPKGISFRKFQCSRRAVIQRDGKGWCKQHDPRAVLDRQKKQVGIWAAQTRLRGEKSARQMACLEACAGIADPTVVPEMLKIVREFLDNCDNTEYDTAGIAYHAFSALLARIDGGE